MLCDCSGGSKLPSLHYSSFRRRYYDPTAPNNNGGLHWDPTHQLPAAQQGDVDIFYKRKDVWYPWVACRNAPATMVGVKCGKGLFALRDFRQCRDCFGDTRYKF